MNHFNIPTACFAVALITAATTTNAQQSDYKQRVQKLEQTVVDLAKQNTALTARIKMLEIRLNDMAKIRSNPHSAEPAQDQSDQNDIAPSNSWLVYITSNEPQNVRQLKKELSVKRSRLNRATQRLEQARYSLDRAARQGGSNPLIQEAKGIVRDYQREKQHMLSETSRLEKEIQNRSRMRQLSGKDQDGQPVKISAMRSAYEIAKTMSVNKWYRITGFGNEAAGTLRINMNTSTPDDPPAKPDDE